MWSPIEKYNFLGSRVQKVQDLCKSNTPFKTPLESQSPQNILWEGWIGNPYMSKMVCLNNWMVYHSQENGFHLTPLDHTTWMAPPLDPLLHSSRWKMLPTWRKSHWKSHVIYLDPGVSEFFAKSWNVLFVLKIFLSLFLSYVYLMISLTWNGFIIVSVKLCPNVLLTHSFCMSLVCN